ncbi:MAG: biotin synthase BioB [Rudaea sp.]
MSALQTNLFSKPRDEANQAALRRTAGRDQVLDLFALPFNDLLERAHDVHRGHHDANAVQVSTLLSIKTGGCPEDCAYCPQSARYATGVKAEKLLPLDAVIAKAQAAKAAGATRFCMGAAWRSPKDKDVEKVAAMVGAVRALGMETCATLGMLSAPQAVRLKSAGLDFYNHTLDSEPEFYGEIIHTRAYQDRLDTLEHVREAGLKTCCGGIVGMGESREQRAGLLQTLANLPEQPQSVPINRLVQVAGTPLAGTALLDPFEFVRTIAVARILMPQSMVRLSAGRAEMSDELQALCFFAGANSIFYGEKLLTTGNPDVEHDQALFARLGIHALEIATVDAAREPGTVHADIVEAA